MYIFLLEVTDKLINAFQARHYSLKHRIFIDKINLFGK